MTRFSAPVALLWLPVLAYAALLAYGSLFPLQGWQWPPEFVLEFLWAPLPRFITRTDITTNLFVYYPLGVLLALALRRSHGMVLVWLRATLIGAGLSLCLEFGQNFLPWRNASNLDVLLNTAGATLGALTVAWLNHSTFAGKTLRRLRGHFFPAGREVEVGLALFALWGLAQLSLRLPSLVSGQWHDVWVPFWMWDEALAQAAPLVMLVYALELAAVALFVLLLLKPAYQGRGTAVAVFMLLLAVKVLAAAVLVRGEVLPRLLSLNMVAGALAGLLLLLFVLHQRQQDWFAIALALLAALVVAKVFYLLNLDEHPGVALFAWQDSHVRWINMTGFAYWLSDIWPFVAAVYLAGWRWFMRLRQS